MNCIVNSHRAHVGKPLKLSSFLCVLVEKLLRSFRSLIYIVVKCELTPKADYLTGPLIVFLLSRSRVTDVLDWKREISS